MSIEQSDQTFICNVSETYTKAMGVNTHPIIIAQVLLLTESLIRYLCGLL